MYEYPKDINQACANIAMAAFNKGTKQGMKSEGIGTYRYVLDTAQDERANLLQMVGGYRAPWAVI